MAVSGDDISGWEERSPVRFRCEGTPGVVFSIQLATRLNSIDPVCCGVGLAGQFYLLLHISISKSPSHVGVPQENSGLGLECISLSV